MNASMDCCKRCGDVRDSTWMIDGFCAVCNIAVKVEAARGCQKLLRYLDSWARFREWEIAHR